MVSQQNTMEYIWDRIPKQKDNRTIRYLKADLDYLYFHGFVDSRRYKLEEWKKAFRPFKQDDDSYVLDRDQFLSLDRYRYKGPTEVFMPGKIQDGPWTDEQLDTLFKKSIGVAADINPEAFWAVVNKFKSLGHVDEHGNLIISEPVKIALFLLIEEFPSPRRRLEKEVRRLKDERQQQLSGAQKNRDASKFSVGETTMESKSAEFKKFETSAKEPPKQPDIDPDKETFDIKSLRKPRGNFRG